MYNSTIMYTVVYNVILLINVYMVSVVRTVLCTMRYGFEYKLVLRKGLV